MIVTEIAEQASEGMGGDLEILNWFALRVRSNFEQMASRALQERGFTEFLPTYRTRRRWSDRFKEIESPLFPGYLFCNFDVNNRLAILKTPGVVEVLGVGKVPAPVSLQEISAVRKLVEAGIGASPWPFLRTGQFVVVERGPLAGVEGILTEIKGRQRIVVSINLLQRSIAAEIDPEWVRPSQRVQPRAVSNVR